MGDTLLLFQQIKHRSHTALAADHPDVACRRVENFQQALHVVTMTTGDQYDKSVRIYRPVAQGRAKGSGDDPVGLWKAFSIGVLWPVVNDDHFKVYQFA